MFCVGASRTIEGAGWSREREHMAGYSPRIAWRLLDDPKRVVETLHCMPSYPMARENAGLTLPAPSSRRP